MENILNKYLDLLWNFFMYDIETFSQPWMYWWLLIPASCYLVFFIIKWAVLTAPFWIPINMVLGGIRKVIKNK